MEFSWSMGKTDFEGRFCVRKKVFMEEQGFHDEFDSTDETAWHLTVCQSGGPVAAARIFPEGEGSWHFGRICVLPEYRGAGLGRKIMEQLEEKAAAFGAKRFVLSAQKQARGFYEKLGYRQEGEEYLDEHCPHVWMVKEAPRQSSKIV